MTQPAPQKITDTQEMAKEPWTTPVLRQAAVDEGAGTSTSATEIVPFFGPAS